jgi:cytoskeletal protein CcmA (bactofilin family)
MSFFSNRRQSDQPPTSGAPRLTPPERGQTQALPASSQPVGFETVLGANTVLEGTLRSSSNVRLDGTFSGTLEISGNVLVGETGKINADINAKNISIAGAVRGNVSGKKVQLLRTGRIWGDIHAQALTTEEGAFIDGKITMISRESPDYPPPTADVKTQPSASGDAQSVPPTADAPPLIDANALLITDVLPPIHPPPNATDSGLISVVTASTPSDTLPAVNPSASPSVPTPRADSQPDSTENR